jgi:N-acetylmuramoyl-L-alanine amidase
MSLKGFLGKFGVALAIAALSAYAPSVIAAPRAEVREVRLWHTDETTRAVVELTTPARYKVFALSNPNRVVLDVLGAAGNGRVRLPTAAGTVRSVRSGIQPGNTLRLVFEVSASLRPSVIEAAPSGELGHRLIVDFAAGAAAINDASVASAGLAATPEAIRPQHAPTTRDRDVVIAVDAGHGGVDPGALGPSGTREKDVVLAIARDLVDRIDAEPGMKAVLTRDGDHFISLRERIARARRAKADMFVSIHADSIGNPTVSGSSVYVLSERGASSEAARWLAERENAADLKGGVSLDDKDRTLANVLLDLSQTASITQSMVAAERVLRSLDGIGEVRKPQVQQAGFVVLKSPDIPSMLVETAYISNRADERKLRQPEYRARIANAIFAGVRNYFDTHAPDGTRLASARRDASLGGATKAR